MKKTLIITLMLLLVAGCGPRKDRTEFGKIIRCSDGMMLPISKEPGKMTPEYTISIGFKPDGLYLQSDEMLGTCYMGIVYEDISTQVDFDFIDRFGSRYTYFIDYNRMPPADQIDKVAQLSLYYMPDTIMPGTREGVDENGETFTYPDFSGYCFHFNEEEVQKYFKDMIGYIKK